MSKYSEVIGSFLRRGNFPLEADYVFKTEEDLKTYYEKPENKAILHKGLLKIVEDDGNGLQSLYWITSGSNGLEFSKLLNSNSVEDLNSQLKELSDKLEQEIKDRKDADTSIWGTNDPSNLPEDLNSILDLSNAIKSLQDSIDKIISKENTLEEEIKAIVGTNSSDIIEYLATLSYSSITSLSEKLEQFFDSINEESQEIDTWVELKKFLEGISDDDNLLDMFQSFLVKIYGDPVPSENFSTLRNIEDFVRLLKDNVEHTLDNLKKELNDTQTGVGLDGDGKFSPDQETNYLKESTSVMNALKTLDFKIKELALNKALETENPDEAVKLHIRKELERTIVNAHLNISGFNGNGLKKKEDGLYMKVVSEYNDGILTLKVNDNVVSQHILGMSSLVKEAYYDPDTESIIIIFKLSSGTEQTVNIPIGDLIIKEWVTDNSGETDTVILTKTLSGNDSPDRLSGDVRISESSNNILVKDSNSLYVKGTSDNIVHEETTVKDALNLKAPIDSPIFTGNPQIQEDPSSEDNSSRIPTTRWVRELLGGSSGDISGHLKDFNNPHKVTAEQVGSYKTIQVDEKLETKADLIDGKVPSSQLPELAWIEV